jgi:hypothetical protein
MLRWTCITLTAIAAVTMATLAQQPGAQPAKPGQPHAHGKLSAEQEKCLKACVDCARECEACFDHCGMLLGQGQKEHLRTLKTCIDCGDICALAAKVIARNGALQAQICDGCARACDACAAECEKHANEPTMKRCADACKACARACRAMIKHAGDHEHHEKK